MNLFILDTDPRLAAQAQCDVHVNKMLVEAAQLLTNPFPPEMSPYIRTHFNQRCSRWTRETTANYSWVLRHAHALSVEYRRRFGKTHACVAVLHWCNLAKDYLLEQDLIASGPLTPFAQAIPERYQSKNAVKAYRTYYIHDKAPIARWAHGRQPPSWWPERTA